MFVEEMTDGGIAPDQNELLGSGAFSERLQ
jgi:hypothetical protein